MLLFWLVFIATWWGLTNPVCWYFIMYRGHNGNGSVMHAPFNWHIWTGPFYVFWYAKHYDYWTGEKL